MERVCFFDSRLIICLLPKCLLHLVLRISRLSQESFDSWKSSQISPITGRLPASASTVSPTCQVARANMAISKKKLSMHYSLAYNVRSSLRKKTRSRNESVLIMHDSSTIQSQLGDQNLFRTTNWSTRNKYQEMSVLFWILIEYDEQFFTPSSVVGKTGDQEGKSWMTPNIPSYHLSYIHSWCTLRSTNQGVNTSWLDACGHHKPEPKASIRNSLRPVGSSGDWTSPV